MDTVKDLMKRIDTPCTWIVHHGMQAVRVPGQCVNARISYGNPQFEIRVHGQQLWVAESSIVWEVSPPMELLNGYRCGLCGLFYDHEKGKCDHGRTEENL